MANIGGGAAYSQLQPLRNDIAQTFQQWNAIEAQKAADEAQRAHQEKLLKDKRRYDESEKFAEGLQEDKDAFAQKVSGFKTIDDVHADGIRTMSTKFAENKAKAIEAERNGNYKLANELKVTNDNILRNVDLMKQYEEHGATVFQNTMKMDAAGKISDADDDWYTEVDAYGQYNFAYDVDDKGNLVTHKIVKKADGSEVKETVDPNQFFKDFNPVTKVQVLGKDGLVADFTATAKLGEYSEETGDMIYSGKKWSPETEATAQAFIGGIYKDDRAMTDLLYQTTGRKKKSGFDAEDYKAVGDYLYTSFRSGLPETKEEKTNWAKKNFQQGQVAANQEYRKAQSGKDDKQAVNVTEVTTEPKENKFKYNSTMPWGKETKYREFVFKRNDEKPITGVIEDAPDAQLAGIRVGENGKVVAKYYIVNNESKVNKGTNTTTTTSAKSNTLTEKVLNENEVGKLSLAGINIDGLTKEGELDNL